VSKSLIHGGIILFIQLWPKNFYTARCWMFTSWWTKREAANSVISLPMSRLIRQALAWPCNNVGSGGISSKSHSSCAHSSCARSSYAWAAFLALHCRMLSRCAILRFSVHIARYSSSSISLTVFVDPAIHAPRFTDPYSFARKCMNQIHPCPPFSQSIQIEA
jgi:hypothetical protein